MPKKSKDKPIELTFNLLNIQVLSSQIVYPEISVLQTKEFKFNIQSNVGSLHELNQVHVQISVNVYNDDMKNLLGSIQTAFVYGVVDLKSKLFKDENGSQNLPKDFIEILTSVSYSTTRGIMYSRFAGTYLGTAFLPVIDPKSFKPELSGAAIKK